MPSVNKWQITTSPRMLRRMGKTGEELAELQNVVSRIIIQGIDEVDPGTGKVNRDRLIDEVADVLAQIKTTIEFLALPEERIAERMERKHALMVEWEAMYDAD